MPKSKKVENKKESGLSAVKRMEINEKESIKAAMKDTEEAKKKLGII